MRGASLLLPVLLVAAAATDAAGATVTATDWKDCATPGLPPAFKVSDVSLEPQPVKPGDTAQFVITAESGQDVSAGTVQMVVRYAGMPIWTQQDSLCDKASCPVAPGPVEVRYTQPFPAITPPGSYSVSLDGRAGSTQLFCVTVQFQVVPPSADELAAGWAAALEGVAPQQVLTAHRKRLA